MGSVYALTRTNIKISLIPVRRMVKMKTYYLREWLTQREERSQRMMKFHLGWKRQDATKQLRMSTLKKLLKKVNGRKQRMNTFAFPMCLQNVIQKCLEKIMRELLKSTQQ